MSPSGLTATIAAMTVIGTLQATAADLTISRHTGSSKLHVSAPRPHSIYEASAVISSCTAIA
jgi:hypothetical protein